MHSMECGICVCAFFFFLYPDTWAATRYLRRISLYSWRVSFKEFMTAEDSSHVWIYTWALSAAADIKR